MWIIDIILNLTFFRSKGKGPSMRVVILLTAIVLIGTIVAIVAQSSIN